MRLLNRVPLCIERQLLESSKRRLKCILIANKNSEMSFLPI